MNIIKKLFSMKMAVVMMVLFGVIIGIATFIENDYGTGTVQALIYKTKWFELFLFYFIAILVYQMSNYKSYKHKMPVFLFHLSFVVIALGALLTRYVGYEGKLSVREDSATNQMLSMDTYMQIQATDGKQEVYEEYPLRLSSLFSNNFDKSLLIGDKKVSIILKEYLPQVEYKLEQNATDGVKMLELMVSSASGAGESVYIQKGESKTVGSMIISYDTNETSPDVFAIKDNAEGLIANFPSEAMTLNMDDQNEGTLSVGQNKFEQRMLYRFDSNAIVLKAVYPKAKFVKVSNGLKPKAGKPEYVNMDIKVGDKSTNVEFTPTQGMPGDIKSIELNGVEISMRIGAKVIELPFEIFLKDFKLDRYPGSMTPSSYASDVILTDRENNVTMPYAIYMNHVLDYRDYRLFQTSYDPDEKGTILSVNHDPGTKMTYLGYLLLSIGMIWALFAKNGRFQKLLTDTKSLQQLSVALVIMGSFIYTPLKAAEVNASLPKFDKQHIEKFKRLVVQDGQGRMKPIDTMATEVVSKITGKTTMFGADASELFLGMMLKPEEFQTIPMIQIGHPQIAKDLGLSEDAKYAKFTDFFNQAQQYKLFDAVQKANQKAPLEKTQYDKELIKADERLNVAYMTYMGDFFKVFPKPQDPNNAWFSPLNAMKSFPQKEGQMVQMITANYFSQLVNASSSGNWNKADDSLGLIIKFQDIFGAKVIPSARHIDFEIAYNHYGLFAKLVPFYILLGVLLIVAAFIHILRPLPFIGWIMKGAVVLLGIGFVIHLVGLGLRWYISDHAPWSNAYESVVFIAATTVLAGLLLGRKSIFALAATALLAGATMGVAHLNFMNPEITPLVPVLKSYWLMIHVALIVSGDGFFGLGFILSLLTLILFIFRSQSRPNIDKSIKELSALSEMSLLIGLVVFTIGNFLGGVWANESWGRYWGWDPKETWAAVTILIYAAVLHLRFMPNLKGLYAYNVAAVWAYSTVLMTYFGVNYYLSGLHSYAAGDPMPIPEWIYVAVAAAGFLTILASFKRNMRNKDADA
ncbi:MAG: cytochrome c biogenesis protein CcsA [Sulfurovaceae bacterium]